MSTARTFPAIGLILVLVATATRSTPAQQEPSTFRSGVNAVRVDVIVTDKDNRPIEDLVQSDFELFEDDAPQTIERFEVVRVDGSTSFVQYAPQSIRTRMDEETEAARPDVGLYLFYFPGLYIPPGQADVVIEPLVEFVDSLPPGDMVGVMNSLTPLSAVMLTRDRDAAVNAIRAEADIGVRDQRQRARLNRESIQPYSLDRGLEAASLHLASLREGRQSLILVSGVAPSTQSPAFSELVRLLNSNNTAVYVVDPSGLVPGGTSGLGPGGGIFRSSDLLTLAERTGGLAITNTNGIRAGLDRIAVDGRMQYLLTYNSPAPADGRFHEISVRVRRAGARIRARSGFLALSATEMRRAAASPRPVDAAVRSALAATASMPTHVRTWLGTARGENGATRVTLAWEPVPAEPGARREVPQRVSVVATLRGGATVYDSQDPADADRAPLTVDSRVPQGVSFDAPPGILDVRLSVYANDEVIDTEERSVNVPDYASPASMSTPAVYVGRSAAELRTIRASPGRAPVVRREFSRTDQLLVRFDAYDGGTVPRATLLNQSGERMHDVAVTAGNRSGSYEIATGVSHLAIGDYALEIVSGESGDTRELIPIKVRR